MAMSQFPCLFQDYELDGVDWTKVEFEDNQECLDLFEKVFLGFTFVSYVLPCSHKLFGTFSKISFDLNFSVYLLILRE